MNQFTNSISRALADKNWNAALFITLSLPDICSRLESDDNRTNGKKYAAWFDKYMKATYTIDMPSGEHTFMSGDDCYVLRCSMLHQGFSDVSHQAKKGVLDKFHFSSLPMHRIQIANTLHLNAAQFCSELMVGVDAWFEDFNREHPDKLFKLNEMLYVHENDYSVGGVSFSKGQG
jgi:hypothetical protein